VTTEAGQNVTVIELEGPIEATSNTNVFNFDLINSTISDSDLSHYERLYLGQANTSDPNEPMSPLLINNESFEATTPEAPPPSSSSAATATRTDAPSGPREKRPSQGSASEPRRNVLSPGRQEAPRRKRGLRLDIDPRRPHFRQPLIPPILTLREQQVLQITREIRHAGGVRLQLRKKDCIGSIAFVDACGGIW